MPVHGVFFPVAQHAGIVTTDSMEHAARARPKVEPRAEKSTKHSANETFGLFNEVSGRESNKPKASEPSGSGWLCALRSHA